MSQIIKAVFIGRFCTTRRIFRWDTDDKLQFVNLDLPQNYTVDFANSLTGQSVPVLATSDTVQIPPDMFVPGSEIYAWVWISDTNGGHTKCQTTIPVDPRAQRSGTSPTPAQQSALDEAIALLNSVATDIQRQIDLALQEAKDSGEFDGPQGPPGRIGLTGPEGPGVSDDLRAALVQLAAKVAYIDDGGATYYQDLYNALYNPPNVAYITASFNQGTTKVYADTPLDDLKPLLTVFGFYDNNTWQTLTNYTLTGTLAVGTSTVTVTALGKTTTFDVLVTGLSSINAVFTQGANIVLDTDSLDSLKQYLVVTANYSDGETETLDDNDYTLYGTLAEGTSTITVAYSGKTTTFTVTVSVGLNSIAYGTKTYRDIFITDNICPLGDFETTLTLNTNYQTWGGDSNKKYKANSGSPSQSTVKSNSPTHSLYCTGSPIPQMNYVDTTSHPTGKWLGCASGCCSAVGVNSTTGNPVGVGIRGIYLVAGTNIGVVSIDEVSQDFIEKVKIIDCGSNSSNTFSIYIGSGHGGTTGYVDDVVFTPLPSGATEEEMLALYQKYCAIRRRGDV